MPLSKLELGLLILFCYEGVEGKFITVDMSIDVHYATYSIQSQD